MSHKLFDWVLLGAGILALIVCLRSGRSELNWTFADRFGIVGDMLRRAGDPGDLAQDTAGFRGLWQGSDAYPTIGHAGKIESYEDFHHKSAHPPTAFLFAAPVAFLPPSLATQVWAILGLAPLACACSLYGLRWKAAVGAALLSAVCFAPIAVAFVQLTFIWLAGVAVAYRFRSSRPFLAGMGIGIASLTKLLPLVMVGYFLFQKKFRAVFGALAVWAVAVAAILWFEPGAFLRYATVNRITTWVTIIRPDNLSVFTQCYAQFGDIGLTAAWVYVLCLALRNYKALFFPSGAPEYSFFLYSFLAVALLPICWPYSLVPLLPVLGWFILRGREAHVVIALLCSFLLIVTRPYYNLNLIGAVLPLASLLFWLRPPEPGGGIASTPFFGKIMGRVGD